MVSMRDIVKGIFMFYLCKIVEERFKKIFFWSDTIISGDVVGDDILGVGLVKGNDKTIFSDIVFYFFWFLEGEDFSIEICEVILLFFSFWGSLCRLRFYLYFLLFGLYPVNNVLRPVEIDTLAINGISDFPPKSSFD